jgi:two-component system, chemotaxis family, protein-glutamate methylesterase/glutaminase
MAPIRVLIADDSAVARRQISEMIETDPELKVVATASSGRMAIEQVRLLRPEVVVLDLAMPDMNGLEVLKVLRRQAPETPVVMFSALTERGGNLTLDALALGASDYLPKPSSHGGTERTLGRVRDELVAKLKALHTRSLRQRNENVSRLVLAEPPLVLPPRPLGVTAVVIGASTGGPSMLPPVLARLPEDFPVPVFVAQHIPPIFSRLLAERLDRLCHLRIDEARSGELVGAGKVWIAPGDRHLALHRSGDQVRVMLQSIAAGDGLHPSVDVLFRSAAEIYGSGVLAVVMTGMGQDGLAGCEAVSQAGGQLLVQEPTTCVVGSMAQAVMQSGLLHRAVPLQELGREIVRRTMRGRAPTSGLREALP